MKTVLTPVLRSWTGWKSSRPTCVGDSDVAKTSQEFYCGECKDYWILINSYLDGYEVEVVCPNCNHEHRRCISKGQIVKSGRFANAPKEKIISPKSSYHKEPIHIRMDKAKKSFDSRRMVPSLNLARILYQKKRKNRKKYRDRCSDGTGRLYA